MRAACFVACVAAAAAHDYRKQLHEGGGHLPHPPRSLDDARRFHRHGKVNAIRRARAEGHELNTFQVPGAVAARREELAAAAPGPRVSPVDFGADPTGATDSTDALQKALNAVLAHCNTSAMLGPKIHDCRGATLDLSGGAYSIHTGLVIPPFHGNLAVTSGTLVAGPGFNSTGDAGFLLTVGSAACVPPDNQKVCNEDVSVLDVLFDAAHRGGCLRIFKTMGTVVFDSYFSRFSTHGIWETGGHELMVQEAWVTAYYWKEPAPSACGVAGRQEVGIQIDGNDNYLVNVIGFANICTGVQINGAANVLTGVHTWVGNVGIRMGTAASSAGASQNRMVNCYLDYSTFDVYNPQNLVMSQTFWLVAKLRLFGQRAKGFYARDNIWKESAPHLQNYNGTVDTTQKVEFTSTNTDVAFDTAAKAALTGPSDKPFVFDFASQLVFPWIRHVQYSVAGGADTQAFSSFVEVVGRTATVHVLGDAKVQELTVHVAVEN